MQFFLGGCFLCLHLNKIAFLWLKPPVTRFFCSWAMLKHLWGLFHTALFHHMWAGPVKFFFKYFFFSFWDFWFLFNEPPIFKANGQLDTTHSIISETLTQPLLVLQPRPHSDNTTANHFFLMKKHKSHAQFSAVLKWCGSDVHWAVLPLVDQSWLTSPDSIWVFTVYAVQWKN